MTRPEDGARWFDTAFGPRYVQLYAHRDVEEAARVLDLLFGDQRLDGRQVLDLACGGGRYLAQLQARGARAFGLDLSSVLLGRARRVARTGSLARADMRAIPLREGAVASTLCMFTSFGYFETAEAHAQLAREIARVTREDIVLDLPDLATLEASLVPESERHVSGWRVLERRRMAGSPRRVEKDMTWFDPEGVAREEYRERVLLFTQDEIAAMFAPAGFSLRQAWSDYDGTPYRPGAGPRCLVHLGREDT